jgi:hypothetical protein
VFKLTSGMLTIAVLTTACGSSRGPEVAAAEPPAQAATPASQPQPAPEQPKMAMPTSEGSRPAARVASRRPAAAHARNGSARVEPPAAAVVARTEGVPVYRDYTLPVGTTLRLELKSTIASDVSEVEDTVRATLRNALTVEGLEVLPAGTELAGHVTEAERAGRVKGRARLAFQFTSLRYDGERRSLRTDPIVQEAEATKGEDAAKIGIGAGAGAIIGAVVGGKSGAAKGAGIGGAAGAGAVMATRGKEVRLEPGTDIPVRLAAPLAIRVRVQ